MKKFKNKLVGKTINSNMGEYEDFLLIDCIVNGNMNEIGWMLRGELNGNMNDVEYICWTDISWNMNDIDKSFDYEEEVEKKETHVSSKLPEQMQVALWIFNDAIEFEKTTLDWARDIEKRKNDYFKKYWTLPEKMEAYVNSFRNR